MTKRIYLAHPISTTGEFNDSKRVANELRALGYEVYVASENDSINDKSNDPTPINIYYGDIPEIKTSTIFVVNVSGGLQDGTISEIGFVAGRNDAYADVGREDMVIPIYAYTSNARLIRPQFSDGVPSASANHLVKGMIDRWGEWLGDEQTMLKRMKELLHD